jgi:hypothetical protein
MNFVFHLFWLSLFIDYDIIERKLKILGMIVGMFICGIIVFGIMFVEFIIDSGLGSISKIIF